MLLHSTVNTATGTDSEPNPDSDTGRWINKEDFCGTLRINRFIMSFGWQMDTLFVYLTYYR